LRWDDGRIFGGLFDFWAGKKRIGESIAQRSRRSQRGELRWDGLRLFGGQHGFWAGKTGIGESIAQRSRTVFAPEFPEVSKR
jgi:Leu/Phe-tRNA-protein transferase